MTISETNADRRERLRKLALEMIDLEKDPYFMRNHLGTYECKLCLTIHTNEGNYLAHTQGKKHQTNLARRAAREASENAFAAGNTTKFASSADKGMAFAKIGRPGYKVSKIRDPSSAKVGFLFQIHYPNVGESVVPCHRFVSSFEQKLEAPNKNVHYLVFAAEPYESVGFKMKTYEIDRGNGDLEHWDPVTKIYTLQFLFKSIQK